MDYELENELKPWLTPHERLLWTGRPKPGIRLRAADAFIIPFSLMWCGFAVFWETSVVVTDAPWLFRLWGIPFVLIGLYMVCGRFFFEAYRRGKTLYGITDSRVVIRTGIFSRETKSLQIKTISDISFKEKKDGSGTITLGPAQFRYGAFNGMGSSSGYRQPPALEFIDDVRRVYDILIAAQRH